VIAMIRSSSNSRDVNFKGVFGLNILEGECLRFLILVSAPQRRKVFQKIYHRPFRMHITFYLPALPTLKFPHRSRANVFSVKSWFPELKLT